MKRLTTTTAALTLSLLVSAADTNGLKTVTGIDPQTGDKVEIPLSDIFRLVDVDTPPKPIKSEDPKLPKSLKKTIISTVSFVVSEKGTPQDIVVEKINLKKHEKLVIKIVEQTRFEPAVHNGEAVAVRIRVPLKINPNQSSHTTPASAPR